MKFVEILKKHVPKLCGKIIGLQGLVFKQNSNDIRESRAISIVEQLLEKKLTLRYLIQRLCGIQKD